MAATSGWKRAAQLYSGPPFDGRKLAWCSVAIGRAGCLANVTVSDSGLSIEPVWLYSLFLPSLRIPWRAVQSVERFHEMPLGGLLLLPAATAKLWVWNGLLRKSKPHLRNVAEQRRWFTSLAFSKANQWLKGLRARYDSPHDAG
jgi:hypothetical protein